MADTPMTAQEVADKVEWEGGIDAALEWGLRSSMIEEGPLRKAWEELEARWITLDPLREAVQKLLPSVEEEEYEDEEE